MSVAALKLQQRRRDQERLLHEKESFLRQHYNTERLLDWENRTNERIKQHDIAKISHELLKEDQNQLLQRKNRLQSVYSGEMNEWKKKLQTELQVTPEQRIEQMRQRAFELKAKREAERQEFVSQCYQQQWRDSCDELRAIDSKATLNRLTKDRKLMIQQKYNENCCNDDNSLGKRRQNMYESQADSIQTNQRMTEMQERENYEKIQRRQANLETKEALDQQLKWKRAQNDAMTVQTKREQEEKVRNLAELEQKAKESQDESIEKAKREGEEMMLETLRRAKLREERLRRDKDRDWILLQNTLASDQKQIANENAKKERGKDMATEYLLSLREQKESEAKEKQRIEAIRKDASDKLWRVLDEKQIAEAQRRRQWMDEIKVSRQEQLKMKQIEVDRLRKQEDLDSQENKASLERREMCEKAEIETLKARRVANMLENKAIMNDMSRDREVKHQIDILLNEQIQNAERVHQQKLEEQKRMIR